MAHYNGERLHSAIGYVTLMISWRVGKGKFGRSVTVNSKLPAKLVAFVEPTHVEICLHTCFNESRVFLRSYINPSSRSR